MISDCIVAGSDSVPEGLSDHSKLFFCGYDQKVFPGTPVTVLLWLKYHGREALFESCLGVQGKMVDGRGSVELWKIETPARCT